jgi:2-keto-4-pentenoate hydratase
MTQKSWEDPRVHAGMSAQLRLRRERIGAGDAPLGWKVGFGSPAAMEKLGITAPLIGFLMQSGRLAPGATVPLAGWTKSVGECEIAVHMGADLAAGSDEATAQRAIAALGPAIELVDLVRPPEEVETILAGNIYQRHAVLGAADHSRAGGLVEGIRGVVLRNGSEHATTTDPQAATGELIGIVRHVADTLAAFGEKLSAGDVIITGAIVPPFPPVEPGEEIVFRLEPIGTISVRFA